MALIRKLYRNWNEQDVYDACKLCLTTSMTWLNGRTLHSCVAEALVGGVSMVELRVKSNNVHEIVKFARNIIPLCRVANVPFIIDDSIEAAKASGADGVHLWELKVPCELVRREFGHDAIVGISVESVEEAVRAEVHGASYLSVGPVFTGRKHNSENLVSKEVVKEIAESVKIPVMAFGGITSANVADLADTEVSGVTCISSILAAPDIEKAASDLSAEVNSYLRSRTIL